MKTWKLLDALIVLTAVLCYPFFWLMEKIIEFRGNGGNDESKSLRGFSFFAFPPDADSPPTEPPFLVSMSGACCPVQHLVDKEGN